MNLDGVDCVHIDSNQTLRSKCRRCNIESCISREGWSLRHGQGSDGIHDGTNSPDQSALAIVRLGGHREGNETAWECAKREVFEESRMRISPLVPSMTFQCPKTTLDTDITLEPLQDYGTPDDQPRPLIIGRHDTKQSVTAMFLTTSDDEPVPSMETKALMLLTRKDVLQLCSETITLEEYQSSGGQVLLGQQVNSKLPLKPFGQLVMLSMILEQYPNVILCSLI